MSDVAVARVRPQGEPRDREALTTLATDFAQSVEPADWTDHARVKGNSGFEVLVASNAGELDALEADWLALEHLSPASAMFQSFSHIRIWARHFLGQKRGSKLHVAAVREHGRPILILPLIISGLPHLRIARIAGDPVAQYSEMPLDPARASAVAFEAALASAKQAGADAIIFRHVRDNSQLLRVASAYLRPAAARTEAPFADLSAFADFPAFLKSLSKKTRQGLRNRRNHLEKTGAVRVPDFSRRSRSTRGNRRGDRSQTKMACSARQYVERIRRSGDPRMPARSGRERGKRRCRYAPDGRRRGGRDPLWVRILRDAFRLHERL